MRGPKALVLWTMRGCGHCEHARPIVQKFAREHGIPVCEVPMDSFDEVCETYSVNNAPTLMLLNNGVEVGRTFPSTEADLERLMLLDGGG